jgi:phosphomevalonate kinase
MLGHGCKERQETLLAQSAEQREKLDQIEERLIHIEERLVSIENLERENQESNARLDDVLRRVEERAVHIEERLESIENRLTIMDEDKMNSLIENQGQGTDIVLKLQK